MPSAQQYIRFGAVTLVTKRDALFAAIEAATLRGRVTRSTAGTTEIEHQSADLEAMNKELLAIETALYILAPGTYPSPKRVNTTQPDWTDA